jgi:hypothetical protein
VNAQPRPFLDLGRGFGSGLVSVWGWVLRTACASISRNSVLVFPGVGFHGLKYMGMVVLTLEVGNVYRAQFTPKPGGLLRNKSRLPVAASAR